MRILLATIVSFLLVAPLSWAQQPTPDAAHKQAMSKFDGFSGNWTGKGSSWQKIDENPEPWSGQMSTRKVLDGRVVERDLTVAMQGGQREWVSRTMFTYNSHADTYNSHSVDNGGNIEIGDCYWTPDKSLISSSTYTKDGQVITEMERLQMRGGKLHVNIQRSINGGEFFKYVEGTFERGGSAVKAVGAGFKKKQFTKPAPQMKKMKPFIGTWKVKGTWHGPEGPMEVSGTQTASWAFGDHIVVTVFEGDPNPRVPDFKGIHYQGFDRTTKRMIGMWFDNWGDIVVDESIIKADGTMVSFSTGRSQGKLASSRGITKPGANGTFTQTSWTAGEEGAPKAGWEGVMTPAAPKGTSTRLRQR